MKVQTLQLQVYLDLLYLFYRQVQLQSQQTKPQLQVIQLVAQLQHLILIKRLQQSLVSL